MPSPVQGVLNNDYSFSSILEQQAITSTATNTISVAQEEVTEAIITVETREEEEIAAIDMLASKIMSVETPAAL